MDRKYTGYFVNARTHVGRSQNADALEHRHSFGMATRARNTTMGMYTSGKLTTIDGCGCGPKSSGYASSSRRYDSGSESSDSEGDMPRRVMRGEVEGMIEAEMGALAVEAEEATGTQTPAGNSEDQFVMLNDDTAQSQEAASVGAEADASVLETDFQQQPPLSEHFIRGFNGLVKAGAFSQDSANAENLKTIVREKLVAGDIGFRSAASSLLGEDACAAMFSVVDEVLQPEPSED